jgi:hypothetical protein
MQSLVRTMGVGVQWRDPDGLIGQLRDHDRMRERRDRMWETRGSLTFDAHADALIELFRHVISVLS